MSYKIISNHLKVSQYLYKLQEMLREWLSIHKPELITMAIGFAITFAVSLALSSGDISEAFARRRRS